MIYKLNILTIIFLLLCSYECIQNQSKKDIIGLFEKKMQVDTLKNSNLQKLRKCYFSQDKFGKKVLSQGYFIYDGFENISVGTDIGYSNQNNEIIEIGTWQQKTDTFMLAGTDTLIVFYNPFEKIFCHVEYLQGEKPFAAGYVVGHAFEWTHTNKLKKETIKEKNGEVYIINYDTLTNKIISKIKL